MQWVALTNLTEGKAIGFRDQLEAPRNWAPKKRESPHDLGVARIFDQSKLAFQNLMPYSKPRCSKSERNPSLSSLSIIIY